VKHGSEPDTSLDQVDNARFTKTYAPRQAVSGYPRTQPPGHFSRLIPILCGGILLTAATLKTEQIFAEGIIGSPWLAAFLIGVELYLGWALVFRFVPPVTRRLGLALFGCFLIVSVYHVTVGAKSCGCFGGISLSPLLAVALDLACLAGLWFWDPVPKKSEEAGTIPYPLTLGCFSLGVVAVLAYHGGSRLFSQLDVLPAQIDLGTVNQGSRQYVSFEVHNPHDRPVTISRMEVSCKCLTPKLSQWKIAPSENLTAYFYLDLSKEPDFRGALLMDIRAFTDDNQLAFLASVELKVVDKG